VRGSRRGEVADLVALNGAAVYRSLAEPAVQRDSGVGGTDRSGRHAEKVPQSPPRALLTAGVGSGDGGGGRGEPAREEGVSRGRPRMERGVAARGPAGGRGGGGGAWGAEESRRRRPSLTSPEEAGGVQMGAGGVHVLVGGGILMEGKASGIGRPMLTRPS
jgi:hypothetical protein